MAVTFTAENRFASEHLTKNAANTPHIYGTGITPQLHEQLRRSVPPRHHQRSVFSFGRPAAAASGGDGAFVVAGESKISDLEDTFVVDEEVGSFHISVKDPVLVEILEALQQLFQVALDLGNGKLDRGVVEKTRQIMVHVGGDHVHDGPLPLVRRLAVMLDGHVLEAQDILVREELEKLDLPERRDGEAVLFIMHNNFLQGDEGACLLRTGLVDLAECTLAQLAEELVFRNARTAEEAVLGPLVLKGEGPRRGRRGAWRTGGSGRGHPVRARRDRPGYGRRESGRDG